MTVEEQARDLAGWIDPKEAAEKIAAALRAAAAEARREMGEEWRTAALMMQGAYQDPSVDCTWPLNGATTFDEPTSACECTGCLLLRALLAASSPSATRPEGEK